MFYGRSHLHKHPHSFEKHRPDPVGLVPVGERSFLEYSERPNTTGSFGIRATADASTIPQDLGVTGVFTLTEITQNSNVSSIQPSSIYKYTQGVRYNASLVSSLYKNDLNEVRVNALYGLTLIRAY